MQLNEIESVLNDWLDANWSSDLSLREWRERLVEGGWAAVHWPSDYFGRNFDQQQTALVRNIFKERKIVGAAQGGPGRLAAETLLAHGNDAQKMRYLRPIITGEEAWCQLFSEPGSGSDLAGTSTKAELKDEKWIVNGQKVWTTSAHHADFGFLLARSDFDVPKHQGLSFYLIDMRQTGVEVRPLKQMNGHASFNEVFMTDAEVPAEDLVGGTGNGWAIATTTLTIERQGFGGNRRDGGIPGLEALSGRVYEEFRKELDIALEPYTWYPQRAGRVDMAVPRASQSGKLKDPVVRQELARLLCMKRGADSAAEGAAQQRKSGSNQMIPAGSIGKLAASEIARQASHVHTLISGADAMFAGADSAEEGIVAEILLSVPAISIAGGTDEIQKNIIAERVLGMPKEARSDTGQFRDIARSE